MTHRDESAKADADLGEPSTRRSRRDGEREAAHRALYADSAQPASSMRVVDGGSPMYRTRREMRESASRLARDLPVIVEPVLDVPEAEAEVVEAPAAEQPPLVGRRARRAAEAAEPTAAAAAPEPAAAPAPVSPGSRRARRMAVLASAPAAPEQHTIETPVVEQAPVELQPVAEQAPAELQPIVEREHIEQAPVEQQPVASAPSSRRSRRAASQPAEAPAEWSDLVAASVPQEDRTPAAELDAEAPAHGEPEVVETVAVETVLASTAVNAETAAVGPVAALPSASVPSASVPVDERVVTRAERRAAQAASSDEVSAAVAAVLGGEQEDVASTPVRSPLRRESRPPRPAVVVARRPVAHAPVVRPSRRVRSGAARKAIQRLAAAGVILSIGSFVAVTSLPAQAFSPSEQTTTAGGYGDVEVAQQLEVSTDTGAHGAEEATSVLTRDDFGVDDALASARMTPEELASLQATADAEPIGPYYGGDPAMPGVWSQLETSYTQSPFPSLAEVPVSSGFQYRWGSFHGGVDMVPGAGTPIYPIANGVVIATWQGNNPGGGGYQVIVEHNIDGQYFQTWYPHMQAGSIQVQPGQVVDITTQLGQVGSTGRSTGAHLHLEIKNSDYISVDPLVWLATREQILEPSG